MAPTPYPDLNEALREFCAQLTGLLGDSVVGVYLHGSLAIGDFDPADSDVDFLVVIADELTATQVEGLKALHAAFEAMSSPFAKLLEGSYLPRALLGNPKSVGVMPLWFYDHGTKQMTRATHDHSWVVFWVMHHHGITVMGRDSRSVFAPVPSALLGKETLAALEAWKTSLAANPGSIGNLWNQSFVVLSVCRMLQTLETGKVHSKRASVQWSKDAIDARWHPLISRAWLGRRNPDQTGKEPIDTAQIEETLAFVEHALTQGGIRNRGGP